MEQQIGLKQQWDHHEWLQQGVRQRDALRQRRDAITVEIAALEEEMASIDQTLAALDALAPEPEVRKPRSSVNVAALVRGLIDTASADTELGVEAFDEDKIVKVLTASTGGEVSEKAVHAALNRLTHEGVLIRTGKRGSLRYQKKTAAKDPPRTDLQRVLEFLTLHPDQSFKDVAWLLGDADKARAALDEGQAHGLIECVAGSRPHETPYRPDTYKKATGTAY